MVITKTVYQNQKHCQITHGPSGAKLETDAPKDNQGKGESFSPTDLVGAALGSCILTTMAIVAERDGILFENATAEVQKVMSDNPRKIASLNTHVTLSSKLTLDQRRKMEETAKHCPVKKSLHPDVAVLMTFSYN